VGVCAVLTFLRDKSRVPFRRARRLLTDRQIIRPFRARDALGLHDTAPGAPASGSALFAETRRKGRGGFSSLSFTIVWLGITSTLLAHDPGLSTANVRLHRDRLEALLVFSVRDVAPLVDLDKDGNGQTSSLESKRREKAFREIAAEALEVRINDEPATVSESRCRFDGSGNLSVYLSWSARRFSKLEFRSKWLPLLPSGHRQFFSLQDLNGGILIEKLLNAKSGSVTIEPDAALTKPTSAATGNSFADFLLLGVKHILTGYDHLLFLFSLLIVSRNIVSTLKIVTCFTVAHSITLALATLGVVQISGRLVEPMIAASIVYVGVENLARGDTPKGRSLPTFAFGLVHGFGFASVLRELGVDSSGSGIVVPLFSFNLGVELGQILVAAALLPLIWKIGKRPIFTRHWVPACSTLVTLVGSYWLVERIWLH
jgi:hydrogenase/urease accessory protein HupE